jgi:hypothetical protein
MAYATIADLASYLGVNEFELDNNSQRLLDCASMLIDMYTLGKVDANNPNHMEAAKLATCAQVEFWQATGDPMGVLSTFNSLSLGSFSATLSNTQNSPSNLPLAPRAYQALFMEGLLYAGVDTK